MSERVTRSTTKKRNTTTRTPINDEGSASHTRTSPNDEVIEVDAAAANSSATRIHATRAPEDTSPIAQSAPARVTTRTTMTQNPTPHKRNWWNTYAVMGTMSTTEEQKGLRDIREKQDAKRRRKETERRRRQDSRLPRNVAEADHEEHHTQRNNETPLRNEKDAEAILRITSSNKAMTLEDERVLTQQLLERCKQKRTTKRRTNLDANNGSESGSVSPHAPLPTSPFQTRTRPTEACSSTPEATEQAEVPETPAIDTNPQVMAPFSTPSLTQLPHTTTADAKASSTSIATLLVPPSQPDTREAELVEIAPEGKLTTTATEALEGGDPGIGGIRKNAVPGDIVSPQRHRKKNPAALLTKGRATTPSSPTSSGSPHPSQRPNTHGGGEDKRSTSEGTAHETRRVTNVMVTHEGKRQISQAAPLQQRAAHITGSRQAVKEAPRPQCREPRVQRNKIGDDSSLEITLIDSKLLPLQDAFNVAYDIENRVIDRDAFSPFQETGNQLRKWRAALMHEIAAGLVADTRGGCNEFIPYHAVCIERLANGVFAEVVRESGHVRPEQTLRNYDVIMHSTTDRIRVLSICMGERGERGLPGFPMLVLHYYDEEKARERSLNGILRITQLANDFSILRFIAPHSDSGMPRTVYALADCKKDIVTKLREDRSHFLETGNRNLLTAPGTALPPSYRKRVSCIYASKYIDELRKRCVINGEQVSVLRKALLMQQYWEHTKPENRTELSRVLLVKGVPGCGKSYTAVFIIITILTNRNDAVISGRRTESFGAGVMVLAKTNKALEVFMDRLGSVDVPCDGKFKKWTKKGFQFYNKRSKTYMRREGRNLPHYWGMEDNPERISRSPFILSTFGNLEQLRNDWCRAYNNIHSGQCFMNFVKDHLKMIVIDEGSQSTLLDLLHFVRLFPSFDGIVIILGDPMQMGPVVLSNITEVKEFLTKSLFTELSDVHDVSFVEEANLTMQYRMHPDIMTLANDIRYEGKIQYGHEKGYHEYKRVPTSYPRYLTSAKPYEVILGPLVVYTTSDAPARNFVFDNYRNWDELLVAVGIITTMKSAGYDHDSNFVFLSPYTEQCHTMRQIFDTLQWYIPAVTVTSYQGHDKSVVICSAARRAGTGIGFLDDNRMVTVAFTRAKDNLVIIGDMDHISSSASSSSIWLKTMESLRSRNTPMIPAEDILHLDSRVIDEVRDMGSRYQRNRH